MALPPCDGGHCNTVDPEIQAACTAAGWPGGTPVPTRDINGVLCTCPCSCLAFGTMVEGSNAFKAIETFVVGDEIMATGVDLDWSPRPVVFSAGTTGASRQKNTVLVRYQNTAIAVTHDHLFLLAGEDKELKRADRLTTQDRLVSPDGQAVEIKGVHIGEYLAGFHHVAATNTDPIGEGLEGHLLNTNGIVSADYAVQVTALSQSVAGFRADRNESAPVVGSDEYIAAHGRECLQTPELPAGFDGQSAISIASVNAADADLASGTFIPAEATLVRVPDDACSFLPPDVAEAKKASPKRSFSDATSRELAENLITHHRAFYPDVTYHLDWASTEVNAYAWVENGVRHVDLKGGLVRDMDLEIEGVSLVLAHELAHHYGGPPVGGSGLSCEGQADYRGVSVVMRKVWFQEHYFLMADPAIAQMAAFFGVPNSPTAPGGSAGCAHPAGACRIATYHAAVTFTGKPACAG